MTNAIAQLSEDGSYPDGTFQLSYKDNNSKIKEITLKQVQPMRIIDYNGNTISLELDKIVSLTQIKQLPEYLVEITSLLFDISSLASLSATDLSEVPSGMMKLDKYFELATVTNCITEKILEVSKLSGIVQELID